MSELDIDIAGERLQLLAGKALYWPRRQMLIVADVHFGKAAAFRALGVPVPHGTTAQNLARLDQLLAAHATTQLVFLGDFLHARAARAVATLRAIQEWRERHPGLRLTLVRGNHDRHAGDPPGQLGIDVVDEPYATAPFAFCHHPDLAADAHVLAGHVHPVLRLAASGDVLRLPCFLVGARRSILPSFGAFTGGFEVSRHAGERAFVIAGDAVLEVKN